LIQNRGALDDMGIVGPDDSYFDRQHIANHKIRQVVPENADEVASLTRSPFT
jgi:hypothetical protein